MNDILKSLTISKNLNEGQITSPTRADVKTIYSFVNENIYEVCALPQNESAVSKLTVLFLLVFQFQSCLM